MSGRECGHGQHILNEHTHCSNAVCCDFCAASWNKYQHNWNRLSVPWFFCNEVCVCNVCIQFSVEKLCHQLNCQNQADNQFGFKQTLNTSWIYSILSTNLIDFVFIDMHIAHTIRPFLFQTNQLMRTQMIIISVH